MARSAKSGMQGLLKSKILNALDCNPSGYHASASRLILCEAQACMREAHDCNPLENHARAKPLIKREALAWFSKGLQSCALRKHAQLSCERILISK